MCGIVGALVFEASSFRVTNPYIVAMRDALDHRGPDGAGVWVSKDGRVGLGHRRLSVIDLSGLAAQPMCNHDRTLWINFNGEIYNHAEIRRELNQIEHRHWKTDHSDTEVVLRAFEQWGIGCLQKLRGMFAMAVWDDRRRKLWLIRDRLGIKPLYYSVHHGRLVFASEIKALLEDPEQKRAVHEEAFYHYLSFLTTPAPQTLFEGIKKVPAATYLEVSQQALVCEHRYWDVYDHTTALAGVSDADIAEHTLSELRDTVKLHEIGDVPVGVFLSGGVDSSTNAALFSEGKSVPIKTFSIGYQGDYASYQNELCYARLMADRIGAEHHELLLGINHLLEFLPRMIELQDEPISDPVCIPVYYVSKLARDHGVTVCHVGEGADELFCGYPAWRQCMALQYASDQFPWVWPKRVAASMLRSVPAIRDNIRLEWLRRAGMNQPIFWGGAEAFTEFEKRELLHPRLRKLFSNFSSYEVIKPIRERFGQTGGEKSHLDWMTYLDLNLRLPELLLMRVDKMSMGVSLEARVPFLDHKFVEWSMSIPEAVKVRNGTLKHLLKKTVRGLIPDKIIDRKKQGFGVPIYEWFFDRLGNPARKELSEFCSQTEYLDKAQVTRTFDQGRGEQVWYMLIFAMWWRTYIAKDKHTSFGDIAHS